MGLWLSEMFCWQRAQQRATARAVLHVTGNLRVWAGAMRC